MSDLTATETLPLDEPSTGLLAVLNAVAAETFDPFALASKEDPDAPATCGRRKLWRVYAGHKPYPHEPLCENWHCYLKTHRATCVERMADAYERKMGHLPLFDGWGIVHHTCVTARDWPAVQKLAGPKRRDARWVRVPVFGGVSHVFSDVDLSPRGSERPVLHLEAEEAARAVLALVRGHRVSHQPTTSTNYAWPFGRDRSSGGATSVALPGAHPLILDRTWELFSVWTVALYGFPSGPDVIFPRDRDLDADGLIACWREARQEAAEEMGWATDDREFVFAHLLGESADIPPPWTPPSTEHPTPPA